MLRGGGGGGGADGGSRSELVAVVVEGVDMYLENCSYVSRLFHPITQYEIHHSLNGVRLKGDMFQNMILEPTRLLIRPRSKKSTAPMKHHHANNVQAREHKLIHRGLRPQGIRGSRDQVAPSIHNRPHDHRIYQD